MSFYAFSYPIKFFLFEGTYFCAKKSPPPPLFLAGLEGMCWSVREVGEAQTRAVPYGVGCWRKATGL